MSEGEKIDFALVTTERLRKEAQPALLNEHRHLHGLAKLGEVDCAELERIHKLVVDEMTRRGLEHNSPLECKAKAGLKLNEPHAYLVWKGKKRSIALPAEDGKGLDGYLVGVPLVLCQNGAVGPEAYGEAVLGNPAAMTPAQFDLPEYADCHCVRPEERREWWDGVKQFYVYPIKSFARYDKPRPVLLQSGCKCYLPDVRFKQYVPPTAKEQEILRQSERLPKQIILTPRAVSLTGSMLYGNHEPRDVDMVVVGAEWRDDEGQFVVPLSPTFKEKLERVLRAVYQTGNSVQYISEGEGPTFDHLPLYALALVRLPRLEVEHVSEMEPEMAEVGYDKDGAKQSGDWRCGCENGDFTMPCSGFRDNLKCPKCGGAIVRKAVHHRESKTLTTSAIERELRGATPTTRRQALQSYTDDAVVPSRPFVPLKPMRPVEPSQRQTVDKLFSAVDFTAHPIWYSSTKRDGIRVVVSKDGDKVSILSDDGNELAGSLPDTVKAVRGLPYSDFVLDCECEMWQGDNHLPREAATAAVHTGDESDLVFNLFDLLYLDGKDLHRLPFEERYAKLNGLDLGKAKQFRVIEHRKCTSLDQLKERVMQDAYRAGSEGVVVKPADGSYDLDGVPTKAGWLKWHKNSAFITTVLAKTESKTPGVFNYTYGVLAGDAKPAEPFELDGKVYLVIGKSFSTAEQYNVGDEIEIEAETVNLTQNEDGTVAVSFWVPNVIKAEGEKYSPNQPRDDFGRFGSGGALPPIASSPTAFLVKLELEDAKLPDSHIDGIKGIEFVEGQYVGNDAYGTFDPASGVITLASNAPKGGNIGVYGGGTILHEVGHNVHLAKLNDEAASEWAKISDNGNTARISAYARKNRGEHFAECYRAYTRGGDHRKKLKNLEPNSYKFMSSLMGERGSKRFLPEGQKADISTQWNRYSLETAR